MSWIFFLLALLEGLLLYDVMLMWRKKCEAMKLLYICKMEFGSGFVADRDGGTVWR
jgi:hypothetical protein